MTPGRTIALITAREVTDRFRNKAYIVGTLLVAAALVGAIVLPAVLDDDDAEAVSLGVVGDVPEDFPLALEAGGDAENLDVTLVDLADRSAAADAVMGGEVEAALLDGSALMTEGPPDTALRNAVETALHQSRVADDLEAAGLREEELAALLSPQQPLRLVDPAGTQDDADPFGRWMVAFGATVLLFAAVTVNGGSLLTGAVEEKSSRVIEVLLGSVRPWQLLAAKIAALTGLALVQVGVVAGAGLVANAAVGTVELPSATTATAVTALVMLLFGFMFYAALYTVAGSLASSAEDAQGSAGPLGFVVMGAYALVIFAVLPSPQGTWAQVLSYLPPTAPFTVPARVALDAMPAWQVVLACGVTLLGAALTVGLAARLYSASVLAGGKLTWREAWQGEPIR